jgi:hypothetical protein
MKITQMSDTTKEIIRLNLADVVERGKTMQ